MHTEAVFENIANRIETEIDKVKKFLHNKNI